jgi:hypothetical protein
VGIIPPPKYNVIIPITTYTFLNIIYLFDNPYATIAVKKTEVTVPTTVLKIDIIHALKISLDLNTR